MRLRAYRVSGPEPSEGASLVFAANARDAKRLGWRSIDFLPELCWHGYVDVRVKWLREGADFHRNAEMEAKGESYVVESPDICERCELWYADGLEPTTRLCWSCFEDDESFAGDET